MRTFYFAGSLFLTALVFTSLGCSSGTGNASGVGGGGGGGATPSSCSKDSDCPSGEGCKTETTDSYCSPLCTTSSQCPVQQQCAGQTDQPEQKCEQVGQHPNAAGVCDLYNGPYGPNTCK